MYDLANNMTILRIKKKYTQKELADKLNVSKGTITSYENGTRVPPIEKLEQLAQIFEIDISLFFKSNIENFKPIHHSRIPILSHISILNEIFKENEILDFLELPSKIPTKCDFATYVEGNSMEPKISDGDIICIKKESILRNKEIGIFILNNQIFIRKVKIDPFRNQIFLVPFNKNYEPMSLKENDKFKKVGKIICKFNYNF